MNQQSSLPSILVAHLFREIGEHVVRLLYSLQVDEWHLPTSSSRRNVKDIATHLLDSSLRRLSMQRDGYVSPHQDAGMGPREGLLEFLNRLNDEWEIGTRRLSPQVLTGLLEWSNEQLADLFESLDPYGPAIFAVAWMGEEQSLNWMDVAREYTEKWHHTQQIFEATGRPSTITSRHLFHPCLDAFLRVLPYTFRDVQAASGTTVAITVSGEAGGTWFIERDANQWRQILQPAFEERCHVFIDPITLWKLVTKRRDRKTVTELFPEISIEGDLDLGSHALDMVAMMA